MIKNLNLCPLLNDEENIFEEEENSLALPAIQEKKVGRNDPCPCGSGKKYKKCCG